MPDRTLVLPLDPPLEHNGGKVTELRLREPTGAEMRDAEKKLDKGINAESASTFQVALVAAVSGLAADAIDKLPVSVMRRAHDFVIEFDRMARHGDSEMPTSPSLDVPLPEPMTDAGVTYDAISVAEPTVGMRRRAETALRAGATTAAMRQYQLLLVTAASGIPYATVEKMPISALNQAETFLQGFIAAGPESGSA